MYADLPLDMAVGMKHFFDPVGHYSRPDMLWLGVDRREKKHVREVEDGGDDVQKNKEVASDGERVNGVQREHE